jgi:hypothetical protein
VLQSQQANAMLKSVRRKMDEAIERLERGEAESEEAPDDPSPMVGE